MSSASERRKSSGGDDEGGANWMDTYGDLVTLLLTFFVLLFSFSSIDVAKWQALVGSFTGMSVIGVDPISPEVAIEAPIPAIGPRSAAEAAADEDTSAPETDAGDLSSNLALIYEILSNYLAETGIDADIRVYPDDYILRVIFPDMVFFETASAVVREEAYPILDAVIEMYLLVEDLYETLIVEGHTDIRPINTPMYRSNWHVSVYRAVNVVSYFIEDGRLDRKKLAPTGYGEEHPIDTNETEEGMARNRRVEFVIEAGSRHRPDGSRR